MAAEFAELGAQRIGMSADPVDRQKDFADKNDLDFPLLSDPSKKVLAQFGVKRPGPLPGKRVTFVIDTNSVVQGVIKSETNMNTHADEALKILQVL